MFWPEVDVEVFSDSLEARDFCDADFFDAEVALRDIYSFPAPGGLQEAFNDGGMLPISHQQVRVLHNVENFFVSSLGLKNFATRTSFVINPTAIHRTAWSLTMTTGCW